MTINGESSMDGIIAAYYDQIYKYCYWKLHDRDEAQDITQDTFIRFMDAAHAYSEIEKPKALLYTIANNLCLNWLQRIHPQSLELGEEGHEPETEDFSPGTVQNIALYDALSTLSDSQQEVLLLRYGQELMVNEIAQILGISRFQVMYKIRTGLARLKKLLKEE